MSHTDAEITPAPAPPDAPATSPANASRQRAPASYKSHLQTQITKALKRGRSDKSGQLAHCDPRVTSVVAAWTGLTQDSDAVEALLTAQMIVTHDLSMSAIGIAAESSGDSRSMFGTKVRDACAIARVTLQQIETLARYRTWRTQMDAEARRQALVSQDGEPAA